MATKHSKSLKAKSPRRAAKTADPAWRLYSTWIKIAREAEEAEARFRKLDDRYPTTMRVKALLPLMGGGVREGITVHSEKGIDDLYTSDEEKARLRLQFRRMVAAVKTSGREEAYDDWNKLSVKAGQLAERVVKAKATTPAGWSAKVEACLFEGEFSDTWLRDTLGALCVEMRRAAK